MDEIAEGHNIFQMSVFVLKLTSPKTTLDCNLFHFWPLDNDLVEIDFVSPFWNSVGTSLMNFWCSFMRDGFVNFINRWGSGDYHHSRELVLLSTLQEA